MGFLLDHAKLQVPIAILRNHISGIWRLLFKWTGQYQPIPREELSFHLDEEIFFKGDCPLQIEGGVNVQGRMKFDVPRSVMEEVSDLLVTPQGAAWIGPMLYERYSASSPGLRMFLSRGKPQEIYKSGYFIQSVHRNTYGDWVSEYLGALARVGKLDAPLFIPENLAVKPYVQRDLSELGIEYIAIRHPIQIERAKVLRQQKHFVHFPASEIGDLRSFLQLAPQTPEPGTIVYLSRRGEGSEVAVRDYPNEIVEQFVMKRGGLVLLTKDASRGDYMRAASQAETVISTKSPQPSTR